MKKYILVNNTSFDEGTDEKVISIINDAISTGQRLKFHFGDKVTGRDWLEEYDTTGTIGRSTGNNKIPLLIKTSRSTGGGALLTRCIVKIVDTKTKRVLYTHENYKQPTFEIKPSTIEGYTHSVYANGEIISNHKDEKSAKLLISKLM